MRILVTGATGLVGSHAAARLARDGHSLRVLARNPARVPLALEPLGLRDVDVIEGDVCDGAAVERALAGCDAVLHAAALLTFDRARVPEMERTNVDGAREVLGRAVAHGCDPVVMVSSAAALESEAGRPLSEDAPVGAPRDPYGRTKADAERVARTLQQQGAPVVCVYPGAVWGPDDPTVGDQVTTILAMVQSGYYLSTSGGMPIIDVRDLAEAIAVMMAPGRGPRRYMLAGRFQSHDDMHRLYSAITGRRLLRIPVPGALLRLAGRAGDLLREHTGFDPGAITLESMQLATFGLHGDDRRTLADLGIALRPTEETLRDQLRFMVEKGLVTPEQAGRAAGTPATRPA